MIDATNARQRALDKRLQGIYSAAYKTAIEKQEKAIAALASLDVEKLRADGLSAEQIEAKIRAYKVSIERQTKLTNNIAAEIARAGQTAAKIIQGEKLNIYDINYRGALTSVDDQLGFAVDWTVWDKNQLKVLLDNKYMPFTQIAYNNLGSNKFVVQKLNNELAQSLILGEGMPGITRRIKAVTGQKYWQARRVARTETLRTANQGRMLGYRQAAEDYGIEMDKQWIAALDDRTRDSHIAMHMKKVPLDEPFPNDLMQPGDINAPPEETINCRCTIVAVLRGLKGSKAYQELNERIGVDGVREMDYNKSIESGKLSPLVSFDDYKEARNLFDKELVGLITADGVEIKRYSKHFIERYFGSVEDKRDGVPLEKIKEALMTDSNPKISKKGNSKQYITIGAAVSLNPKTGNLIQISPLSSRRR